MKITTKNHKIIIEPIREKRKKYDINDLVKNISDNYNPYEEFNEKIGTEDW